MVGGGDFFYLKFWVKLTSLERNRRFSAIWRILTNPLQKADFQSIFARNASAVTSSKKFN